VPPGDYVFRVVASSDAERALGRGGDPNGADISLSVPADAAGVYFRYDALTGEIVAEPVANAVTLVTDLGEQFAMAPARGGGYEATWDAQPGSYGFQVLFNGQPVAQDSVSLDNPSRVVVAVDDAGAVTMKDTLRDTRLDVTATDASGAPRPGSCFAVIDRDGALRTQGCDTDDGQLDGVLRLRVPNGLDGGIYTLRETLTAEGGTPAEDQRIELGAGRFEATASTSADQAPPDEPEPGAEEPQDQPDGIEPVVQPVTEPGDAPGRLTVIAVDAAGQPLPGPCFAVVELGFEVCDDDSDGAVVFDAVPAAPLTLRETAPPPGFTSVGDLPITIEPTGTRLLVPHEQAAGVTPVEPADEPPPVEPAETPQDATGEGEVALALRDREGNPVPGGCWALTEPGGNETIERCDGDDGVDDGVIGFDAVPAGRYRLAEVTTPDGFQPADSQGIDVVAGAPVEVTVEYQQARGRPGRLIILVADDNGDPVPQTCFDVQGPVELSEVCDRQDDGQLNVPDLPAGEYTVIQTQTAEGFTPAAETSVVVPEDDTVELPLVNARAEAEGQEPEQQGPEEDGEQIAPVDEGGVIVTIRAEDGALLSDACVALDDGSSVISVCDDTAEDESDAAGQIEIGAIAPGDYTLTVTPPDGFDAPSPATIRVAAGPSAPIDIVLSATETEPENGSLSIVAEDLEGGGDRLPMACYTIEVPPGGQAFGPFCDEDGDGEVTVQGVTPGPIAVVESSPPPDTEPAEPARQEVEIIAGEAAEIIFRHDPSVQEQEQSTEGTVDVRVTDAAGQPVAACIELTSGEPEAILVCDDSDDDTDDRPGQVRIERVPAGSYTVALTELPGGLPDPGTQNIDVEAGEVRTVDFAVASGPGTLVIFVENDDGERIGGSCFTLEGETEAETLTDICDQGDDGRLNFPDLPSGDYTIVQTRAGANRQLAPEQTVTIEPGQTVEVTLLNPREPEVETPTPTPQPEQTPTATAEPELEATATPESTPEPVATAEQPVETGMLSVVSLAPDGSPLGDGCFVLTDATNSPVAEVCDNDASDFDSAPGVVAFGGIAAGQYTLTQTAAAEGFSPAAPAPVEHGVDATVVEVVSQPATEETGVVELVAFDAEDNPIAGQCYTLVGVTESFGPFCDDGEGDTSTDAGVLTVQGLPVGTYEAVLETTIEVPDAEQAQQAKPRRSVSVRRGGRPTRTIFNLRAQQRQRGDLLIRVRDEDGSYLADACFGLTLDGETAPSAEVCDNRGGDENSADGRILLTSVRAGRYTLTQTTAPTGYATAADQSVRIAAGSVREVAITNQAEPERTASLDVETVDAAGTALPAACYAIMRGNSTLEACDDDDDGITRFAGIPAGSYVVRQIQPPAGGYTTAGSTATRLDPGQAATVTVVNEARPGSLVVRKTDAAGQLLAGSCFALRSGDRAVYTICDNDASDANTSVGVILLGTVAPGTYTLRETQPPIGYLRAADQEITIAANQRSQITVVNPRAPEPQRTGDLRVFKLDTGDRALAGSCFALLDGEGQVLVPRCDADDGADNGVVLMEGIAPGEYTLRETRRPSADYQTAPDVLVEVAVDQTVDVEVVNRLRAGRILIRKTDPNGQPLGGACFDLVEDGAGASCTDDNGELLFAALPPGVYRVVETEAPAGYLVAPVIDPITVRPGSTATLDVVNQPAPPPPDSGSIQVRKFVCPVAEGGGGIVFVDSSDPDGGGLARTAGCDIGDAAFVLDGPSGPIEFRTGAGGRYQTTLETGDYVLTELSTGGSEPLTVRVNTLTTVVVVNYVEPEGEQPATIDVVKYTCAPGFQGRVWLDFAEACLGDENLTNNVGFRISGAVSARRVTGDIGVGGATRFDGLPPGEYRLREETPLGTVAVYAFCGVDPASPNGRGVGDAVNLRLASGQTVTCHWFNVPEDLAGDTGAITVYKYACPVTVPPATFDWYGRCDPQGQGVEFSLSIWDGSRFLPVVTGATDGDGILRFTRLQPGTYDLQEVDATWCHAESDSVNAQGQVVVAAGERASVWIFNCVGAKNPPNTGAGPGAFSGSPWPRAGPAVMPAAGLGLSLLWPLAGLVVLRRWGRAA
jgi:uncharacterized surface anchored protein